MIQMLVQCLYNLNVCIIPSLVDLKYIKKKKIVTLETQKEVSTMEFH